MEVRMRQLFLALIIFPVLALGAETKRTAHIDGMTCPSCAASIEKQFKKIPQVSDIDINIRKGTAVVSVKDGQDLSDDQIKTAIETAGYKLKSVDK